MTCLSSVGHLAKLVGGQSVKLCRGVRLSTSGVFSFSTTPLNDMDISGIYPPIATPFNNDETIAYDKLQHNMDMWNKIPLRGTYTLSLFIRQFRI